MPYLFLFLFMALVFGICYLVDVIAKRLKRQDDRKAVRLPRRTAIFGVLLTFFGVTAELTLFEELSWYLHAGLGVVFLLGVFLLLLHGCFSIRYDETGFTYRALGQKKAEYLYADILGQRSYLTRGGVNTLLLLTTGQVQLYSAMQGADDFLRFAFYRWCEQKQIDPDTVENNPQYLTYFPDVT